MLYRRRKDAKDTRLLSVKEFFTWAKRDKSNLIEYIMSLLDTYPQRKLAGLAYTLTKATLPRLRVTKRKALPYNGRIDKRRKKMTLAEKKKFLARLNKGRIKAGLKPIRAKR